MSIRLPNRLDLQGHRGCRGLMPENTVPAFLLAIDLGVTTLEMDVVITQDHQVVVSHEPYMSHEFCTKPDGEGVQISEEKSFNIYKMPFDELSKWDCGLKIHPRFPQQKKIACTKPKLKEVLAAVKEHTSPKNLPDLYYNIEIKSTQQTDLIYHPEIAVYCELLISVLKQQDMLSRSTIQSFDKRALQYIKSTYGTSISLSFLIEGNVNYKMALKDLGFLPDILSPEWLLVNENMTRFARDNGIQVIPWTVNEVGDMKTLIGLGVSGLISDYPDLYKQL